MKGSSSQLPRNMQPGRGDREVQKQVALVLVWAVSGAWTGTGSMWEKGSNYRDEPTQMVRWVSEARGRGWHSDSTGGTSKCRGREQGRHPCVLEQLGWTEAREWVGPGGLHWKLQEPSAGWQVCCLLSGDCPGGCVQMAELGEWPGSLLLPPRSPRGGLGFS